jgi:hypothetical protein
MIRKKLLTAAGFVAAACGTLTLFLPRLVRAGEQTVSYPSGYRAWTFLHSSLAPPTFGGFSKIPCVKPCTNGIFYFYANPPAMTGLRTGSYPEGAVIAEEMLEYRVSEKGYAGEGRRILTAVMVKDSHRYASTGGWGFGNFDEGSNENTLDAAAQQACFQCHVARKDQGYVFATYSDR